MKLLLTQKNDIFDILLDEGLNPKDFKFTEEYLTEGEIVTYIRYRNTKYYFMFRSFGVMGYGTEYSPAEKSLEETENSRGGWKQFSTRVRRWLKYLKRETNTVDKWETFKKELQLIPFAFDTDNERGKFSADELKFIEHKIGTIKDEIKKLELPEETIKQLNEKLDSLNEKADKLSKIDWKELFIGAIIRCNFQSCNSTGCSEKYLGNYKAYFQAVYLTWITLHETSYFNVTITPI